MSRAYTKDIRVLAIDPSTRGFGFAVLEGPERLIDWGVKETKIDKNKRTLKLDRGFDRPISTDRDCRRGLCGKRFTPLPPDSRADQRHLKARREKENQGKKFFQSKSKAGVL